MLNLTFLRSLNFTDLLSFGVLFGWSLIFAHPKKKKKKCESALDRSNVQWCYEMFSDGQEDVNDEENAGRPNKEENIDDVKKIALAKRRITFGEVAEDFFNLSITSEISQFRPKSSHRINVVKERPYGRNLLQRVMTSDETWALYLGGGRNQSSIIPKEPRPKKARQVLSIVKVLPTVFCGVW